MSKELGRLVREARDAKKWTQRDLAQRIGKSPGYIGQLETGGVDLPGQAVIDALAQSLGLSHTDILRAAGRLETPSSFDPHAELRRINGLPDHSARVAELRKLPSDLLAAIEDAALDLVRQGMRQQLGSRQPEDEDSDRS